MAWRNCSSEYHRMTAKDQKAFRHWLITSTTIGAALLVGLTVINSMLFSKHATPATTQPEGNLHAEAR